MWVIRFVEGTPIGKRKHDLTLGRFDTWLDAEDARSTRPGVQLTEVVER